MARLKRGILLLADFGTHGRFQFSTAASRARALNLAKNAKCVVCTKHAHEAVIVEGTAEIADIETVLALIRGKKLAACRHICRR